MRQICFFVVQSHVPLDRCRQRVVTSATALSRMALTRGLEVLGQIRQEEPNARVVMVTAKGGFEDKFEGMRSGADDYVVKPVDLKELAEKVERTEL